VAVSKEGLVVRVLVVYESMFGNTRDVALAVAEGLRTRVTVDVMEVGEAPAAMPPDVAMLVIGAPTHAHGMTTPSSREDAARRAGDRLVSRGIGVREWLGGLRPSGAPIPAAVFDTRIKGPGLLWGSAARSAEKLLADAGLRLVGAPRSFLVGGPTGDLFDRLEDGELDRARAWGAELSSSAPAGAARTG
jgi:hypothetical protein